MENYKKKLINEYFTLNFLAIFFCINIFILFKFCSDKGTTFLTFFINLLILMYTLYQLSLTKKFSPLMATYFVFFYVYFWITPIFQVDNGTFPNTINYNEELVTKTNINIMIFMLSFSLLYKFVKTKPFKFDDITYVIDKKLIKITLIISIIITIIFFKDLVGTLFNPFSSNLIIESNNSEINELIVKRFLFMIPLGYIFLVIASYKTIKNKLTNLSFSIIFIILYYNPMMQKRNSLGPIILTIIFFLIRKKIGNVKYTIYNVVILLLVFPAMKIISHDYYINDIDTIIYNIKTFSFYKQFIWLDFDAYSNSLATILYVKQYGLLYGKQLLSSILFFIPRSIWPSKAMNTGVLIGGFLMTQYGMWFDNLANPIVSEAYIDFGFVGIIVYGAIFGYLSKKVELSTKSNFGKIISIYISLHMIFLMRGALMVGIAYLIGPLIAIFIPIYIRKKLDN